MEKDGSAAGAGNAEAKPVVPPVEETKPTTVVEDVPDPDEDDLDDLDGAPAIRNHLRPIGIY